MPVLGLDVGGTKIEAAIIDQTENILIRERIPTERDKGYDHVLTKTAELVRNVLSKSQLSAKELRGIGIGMPGTVHPKTQLMLNGNSQIFIQKDIRKDLARALSYQGPIRCANDANCFALAEVLKGAGKQYALENEVGVDSLTGIGIILGTGCGGGVVINGSILKGKSGGASEFGHTTLVPSGDNCYCGRQGCAELYLSGTGFENEFYKFSGTDKLSAQDIFELARMNNNQAKKVVQDYRERLARFITDLCNSHDPHFVVLGGGVSQQDDIYEDLEEEVWQRTFVKESKPKIFKHHLGDSAGVLGAALLI